MFPVVLDATVFLSAVVIALLQTQLKGNAVLTCPGFCTEQTKRESHGGHLDLAANSTPLLPSVPPLTERHGLDFTPITIISTYHC